MKIFLVAPECVPFAKTGGLADVVGALPKALVKRGHHVSVFLPRYRGIEPGPVVLPAVSIPMGRKLLFPDVMDGRERDGVSFYFVDYPVFYDRKSLYGENSNDYPDNAERYSLFARAVLEFAKRTGPPDVIHCHDWQSSLVPVLLKTLYATDPQLRRVGSVMTVHNLAYQGIFPPEALERISLPADFFSIDRLEFYGLISWLKGGLISADYVSTVSKKYAKEIQTPEYGHGLDGVIRQRTDTVTGILNGVDYDEWNPETDPHIAAHYSADNLEGKLACKKDLLEQFGLPTKDLRKPVIGIVSRFATQKGFDLIAEDADAFMKNDLLLVALGTGEPHFEELFRQLAKQFPTKMSVRVAYDNALAHKIEAGSDIFLMPSRWEPCGLNQIYSLRYGTVPVVRATGGLDDTVEPYDPKTGHGTGFRFTRYAASALLDCLLTALKVYRAEPAAWRRLMINGMKKDFSWNHSAGEYEELFRRVVKKLQRG